MINLKKTQLVNIDLDERRDQAAGVHDSDAISNANNYGDKVLVPASKEDERRSVKESERSDGLLSGQAATYM